MLDHAALTFIIPHQRRKHRQSPRIARGPASGPHRIGIQIKLCAVGSLPTTRGQFRLPHFPNRTDPRRDDNGVTIAADAARVHLPLLQRQTARVFRPGFNRHDGWNRIAAIRKCSAVEIGFVRIIEEWNRHARLIVRDENEIHFIKRPQRLPARRQIGFDLRDHRKRVRQHGPPRNVFVPGARYRKDLHGRDDRVGLRCVEQRWHRHGWRRPENSPFLINPLRLRRRWRDKQCCHKGDALHRQLPHYFCLHLISDP